MKSKDLNGKVNLIKTQVKLNYTQNTHKIKSYMQDMTNQISVIFAECQAKYSTTLARLTADNPLGILQKGYWYISKDGQAVLTSKDLSKGDSVSLKTHDGQVKATITEV